jgi:hypothetical protein
MMGNGSKYHRSDVYIHSNAGRETNPAVVVVWSEGEAIRQKGCLWVRARTFKGIGYRRQDLGLSSMAQMQAPKFSPNNERNKFENQTARWVLAPE